MSAAVLQQLRDAAVTAISNGDYDTARLKIEAAITHIKLTPNFMSGQESLQWQSSFDDLLRMVQRSRNASRGVVTRVPVRHGEPDFGDCE